MDTTRGQVGWRLTLKCILVYGASWTAGLFVYVFLVGSVGYGIARKLENTDPAQLSAMEPFLNFVSSFCFGALLGATIGLVQWALLSRHLGRASGWLTASALGSAMGLSIGILLSDRLLFSTMRVQGSWEAGLLVPRTAFSAVWQGAVGLLQWFVLRRRTHWAWEWIPTCWLSGTVGGAIGLVIDSAFLRNFGTQFGAGTFISPLVGGLIVGMVLAWLLRQPKPFVADRLAQARVEG